LDLGCGSGRSTQHLKAFCNEVNGCDINDVALEEAKRSNPENTFFNNDNDACDYDHGKYSTIFSILMFFHFCSEESMKKELIRCYRLSNIFSVNSDLS